MTGTGDVGGLVKQPESSRTAHFQSPSNRVSWILTVLLLAFSPLAFGAVEYWAAAILECGSIALVLSWIFGSSKRRWLRLRMDSMVVAGIVLQIWVAAQWILKRTEDPTSTREALILLFCYFGTYVVVSNEYWSLKWIQRIAFGIAGFGFLVAFLGIVQFLTWNGRLYWIRSITVGFPFGPYINRNHFAGLMEMTCPIAFGLCFSKAIDHPRRIIFAVFSVVMGLATLISLSRGGIVSLVAALAVFGILYGKRRGIRPAILALGLFIGLVGIGLAWLGADPLIQRILTVRSFHQEASFAQRLLVAKDSLAIIRDHPFTGTGLGTFALAFPRYQSWYTGLRFDKAHNDYLQLLIEVGLVGIAPAVVWVTGLFRSVLRMLRDKSNPFSPLRLAAFSGCFGILVHSLVDFNLQIPANALYFAVLAGIATREDINRKATTFLPAAEGTR